MSQSDSQSAGVNRSGGNRDAQELGKRLLIRLLIATAALTAVAWIIGGGVARVQTRQLEDLEEAWAPNQVTYERLLSARENLSETRRLLSELNGSWRCPVDSGSLIGAVSVLAPDRIEIGKIRIDSTLTYNQPASVTDARDVPFHEVNVTVAGRCYAEDDMGSILDFQKRLQQDGAVTSRFSQVIMEGTQRMESRGENSLPSHTVFAFRLVGPPHPLALGESAP